LRSVLVKYQCSNSGILQISKISEHAKCEYEMIVDTPYICKQDIESLLEASLAGKCLRRIEGWWIFEFCYGKYVRQYHEEEKKVSTEYYLGRYKPESNKSKNSGNTQQAATIKDEKDLVRKDEQDITFYSKIYENGTGCDKNNKTRQTEVRFFCSKDSVAPLLQDVKEPATCHYVLNVMTPLLCSHPLFAIKEPPVEHIQCSPLPGQNFNQKDIEADIKEWSKFLSPANTVLLGDMKIILKN